MDANNLYFVGCIFFVFGLLFAVCFGEETLDVSSSSDNPHTVRDRVSHSVSVSTTGDSEE